jgi:hypothetical protein
MKHMPSYARSLLHKSLGPQPSSLRRAVAALTRRRWSFPEIRGHFLQGVLHLSTVPCSAINTCE